MSRISIEIGSYNQRRYGKPWIARVTAWPVGGRPELAWGGYTGDDQGGELEVEAAAGDVIRWGQKDGRGNGGKNEWGIVRADLTVEPCSQPDARRRWEAMSVAPEAQPATPAPAAVDPFAGVSDEALLAEIRRRGLTVTQEQII